ncbi:hypothetical protein L2E82_30754 [Cichorium intybus]|uniref:Uncharacterized protein n=1 Tax=Cichorium intybus TaxID=13427 RepID=A0ACB9D1D9_CICIN|nr:hypothetical protein L2E82_30754 [Cichorium intybus]
MIMAPFTHTVKNESVMLEGTPRVSSYQAELLSETAVVDGVTQQTGKHYRGVRQRPWSKFAVGIRDLEKNVRNVIVWTVMIQSYPQNNHIDNAYKLFDTMPRRDIAG